MAITQSKNIELVSASQPERPIPVTLSPGTTVAEAKRLAAINGGSELIGPLGGVLANEENLYEIVDDDARIMLARRFTAGNLQQAPA